MIVIDHAPHSWFLLQDDAGYVLDVNCGQSAVGFSVVLRLTADEAARIAARGRDATAELAAVVQSNPTGYAARARSDALEGGSYAAILRWQAGRADPSDRRDR